VFGLFLEFGDEVEELMKNALVHILLAYLLEKDPKNPALKYE
jgi:hypothetical protein